MFEVPSSETKYKELEATDIVCFLYQFSIQILIPVWLLHQKSSYDEYRVTEIVSGAVRGRK